MFYENTSNLISQLFSIVPSMNFNSEDIAHNLYFLGARGHPPGAYSARVFHLCPFASICLPLPP